MSLSYAQNHFFTNSDSRPSLLLVSFHGGRSDGRYAPSFRVGPPGLPPPDNHATLLPRRHGSPHPTGYAFADLAPKLPPSSRSDQIHESTYRREQDRKGTCQQQWGQPNCLECA